MKENHFATNMDRLVEALGQQNTLTTAHAPMTVEEARALLCFSKVNSNYKAKVIRQAAVELRERKLKKANDTENEHDNNSNNNYDSTSAEQLAQERHAVSYASLTQKIRNLIEQVGGTQKGDNHSTQSVTVIVTLSSLLVPCGPHTNFFVCFFHFA